MRTIREPPAHAPLDWQRLLVDAVTQPGLVSAAYAAFWNYSLGNMIWAHLQCLTRDIEVGPIHTFRGWLKLNRHVRKGEKALTLVMPVRTKRLSKIDGGVSKEHASEPTSSTPDIQRSMIEITRFVERPYWFTLSQTDGEPYTPLSIPAWDEALALYTLGITREPFHSLNGNVQGYAHGRSVAVSPLAYLPHRTLFHEIAHVLLGHTAEVMGLGDTDDATPRDLREVEAECVAMLCACSLGMPGEAFSRGYVQHWFKSDVIPDRSVQRIFKAADALLKAGLPPAPLIPAAEADAPTA